MTEPEENLSTQPDTDYNDDNESISSEGSVFLGSLGIYVPEGTWDSDLRVNLDLQLGRDEWSTSFSAIEGGKKILVLCVCFFKVFEGIQILV